MNLTDMAEVTHIVKFEESLVQFKYHHWGEPFGTQWHEVNPTYCRQWYLVDWYDSQPNGIVDYCDYILMVDKETGISEEFHVESLSTDMWLTISHDIAVTNVTKLKTVVCRGYPMNINVTVENQGYNTETFTLTVYANTTAIAAQIVALTRGSSTTLTFKWNVPNDFPKGNYTISAYASPVPGEINTADNTFVDGWVIVSFPVDITGLGIWPDGRCDGKDIGRVCRAYLSYPGHPRWDANCDINNDNKVDGKDIGITCLNYLKTDP
jgi:hypothetical protein